MSCDAETLMLESIALRGCHASCVKHAVGGSRCDVVDMECVSGLCVANDVGDALAVLHLSFEVGFDLI